MCEYECMCAPVRGMHVPLHMCKCDACMPECDTVCVHMHAGVYLSRCMCVNCVYVYMCVCVATGISREQRN